MKKFDLPIRFEAIPYIKYGNNLDDYSFLLIKRTPEDGGFWQPVTGTLESSESLEECLYRELNEEISISKKDIVKVDDMFYSFTWNKNDVVISEFVFGVEIADGSKIKLSNEHTDQVWCDFDSAIALLSKKNNRSAFKKFARVKALR